ncbi:MAG TPA: hypothetical protein VFO93_06475 [Hymenobacter sp.]|uniref:hypothetical protein n=1 Tax=Hymenobacter sp. TaxID=1898978 RepID=UPI002D7E8033|nr:hypothetical protein [Hymenobacter sp.]HET9503166.1 hypothetical protein [Hymenobacter sp.]
MKTHMILQIKKTIRSLSNSTKKKTNGIVFTIASIFSIIFFLIPFFIRDKSESINSVLSVALSAVSTVLTAATFIIAYFLYERLSLDRRIMDKQADTVLQLADFLKGKTFTVNSEGYGYFIRLAIHQLEDFASLPNYPINAQKGLMINSNDYNTFFYQLSPLMRSYWMPLEIKEKLQFLEFRLYLEIEKIDSIDKLNNYINFQFDYKSEKANYFVALPETTLESFVSDLKTLVQVIEQWINDRSSIPLELRLWEPS